MRFGGPIFGDASTPLAWARAIRSHGYRAAYCPVALDASDEAVAAYARAAQDEDIAIAEVGAWSNPLSPDQAQKREAMDKCKRSLDLADRIGALCCVNIAGSRGQKWDGPHPQNLTPETFEMIVESVREIIDAVEPARTFYTLETMPWMYPDSAVSYLDLIHAIDRPQCAAHLDMVNLINSPRRFFDNTALTRECFGMLGPWIKGAHLKDIALSDRLTVHLDEVRAGLGGLDLHALLTEMARLHPDTPLMLEHLPGEEEYALAAEHVRRVARELETAL